MSDPRRMVLVAHPSSDMYGSDRVLLESVSGLIAAGYAVVVALPSPGPLATALGERGAELRFVEAPVLRKSALRPAGLVKLLGTTMRALPATWKLISTERPQLVLVNTITIPLWLLVARIRGVRVACHVHEAEHSLRPGLRRLLYLPLLLANLLVVNSNFSLGVLAESWKSLAKRGRLVYNGVPGPEHPTPIRATLEGQVRLLFLGRLSPRKGPQVALSALAELESAHPGRFRLDLLGAVFEGYEWFEQELRDRVRDQGLTDSVNFIGFDPDIWAHLAVCDIVLVPSTVDEPFGNTAVEAILALRPLVVSDTSGLQEAAGGYATARLVRPDDSGAIVAAIEELTANWTELASAGEADRELAIARHAPAVYQSELVEVLMGRDR